MTKPPAFVNHVPQSFHAGGPVDTADVNALERRLAVMEEAEAAVVLASGMAATACTMLALLRTGDHVIASAWLHGATRRFFERELPLMGIHVTFLVPTELRAWRRAVQENTRALYLESPVYPTTRIVDLLRVRRLTEEHGIALVVDSTFASPVNCRPIAFGADVVLHSATEFLSGEGAGLAGVVCGTEALVDEVREKMAVWGPLPDPASTQRLQRGLDTFAVRMERQNESALNIARWAERHAGIQRVVYPGLPSHPDHALADAMFGGFGASIALSLTGGARAAERLLDAVTVFQHTPAVGGVVSSVRQPACPTHLPLAMGAHDDPLVDERMIHLHIGLDDVDHLIADLTRALAS